MTRFLFLPLALLFSINCLAQNDFEGIIEFKISHGDIPEDRQFIKNSLPTNRIVYIKDSNVRTETVSKFMTAVTISNLATKTGFLLIDSPGNKRAIAQDYNTSSKTNDKKKEGPEITLLEEYEDIAGYRCQKALLEYKDKEGNPVTNEFYFTRELPNFYIDTPYLPGGVLKMTSYLFEIELSYTAVSVTEVPLLDSAFEVPDDYTLESPGKSKQED